MICTLLTICLLTLKMKIPVEVSAIKLFQFADFHISERMFNVRYNTSIKFFLEKKGSSP